MSSTNISLFQSLYAVKKMYFDSNFFDSEFVIHISRTLFFVHNINPISSEAYTHILHKSQKSTHFKWTNNKRKILEILYFKHKFLPEISLVNQKSQTYSVDPVFREEIKYFISTQFSSIFFCSFLLAIYTHSRLPIICVLVPFK